MKTYAYTYMNLIKKQLLQCCCCVNPHITNYSAYASSHWYQQLEISLTRHAKYLNTIVK